jgi:micrococcal nuclease
VERKLTIIFLVAFVALTIVGEVLASREITVDMPPGPIIERTAIVSWIIDGDTISLEGGEKVRLVGISTSELGTPSGDEAMELLEDFCPPGTEVGLNVDDLEPKDRHGRTLAVVYVRNDGFWTNMNAELLQNGLAEVMFIPPSEFNPY